jgi:hypothetical protein
VQSTKRGTVGDFAAQPVRQGTIGTSAEPYKVDDPFGLFVQRVESLISKENTTWSQYIKSPKVQEQDGRNRAE